MPHHPYAAGLAAALLLGACSGGSAAPTPPSTGVSSTTPASGTSTTSSPTSSVSRGSGTTSAGADPNVPAAARANTAAGAEAFTTYFLDEANAGYKNLRPELIEPLVESSCKTCVGFLEQIKSYKAKGQRYDGEFVTPTLITISSFLPSRAIVFVSTDTKTAQVLDSSGKLVESLPAEKGNSTTYLSYESLGWKVTEIRVVA